MRDHDGSEGTVLFVSSYQGTVQEYGTFSLRAAERSDSRCTIIEDLAPSYRWRSYPILDIPRASNSGGSASKPTFIESNGVTIPLNRS